MKKPNFLFILADDMRYDTIAAIGNPEIKTPNLDVLVKNGTNFCNAHIPGGTHAAVCMPSRAMINTGRFLFSLDNCGNRIPKEHALLGETLKNNGYKTFGTGKWHNFYDSYARSFTEGAEIFFGGMYDHWKVPTYHYDESGHYSNTINDIMNPGFENVINRRRCDHVNMGKHSTDLFAEVSCKWIEEYNSDDPFYLYLSYLAPHDPRSMPDKYLDLYRLEDITLPENFMSEHPFDYGISRVRDEKLMPVPRDPNLLKKHLRDYYAMISHLDDTVGMVIESLKKSGKYDDTIIIFASDNGLSLGQHGLIGKQSNYEHSIRVPLVISGPGIPKNETRCSYIYLMDLFPTLCDLACIEIPDTVEGISFKPAIKDNGVLTREYIFAIFEQRVRSIKDYRYKLIEYKYKNLRKTQLFDLENDPYELCNLFHNEDARPIVKRLRNELYQYALKTGDMDSDEGAVFWSDYKTVEECKSAYVKC